MFVFQQNYTIISVSVKQFQFTQKLSFLTQSPTWSKLWKSGDSPPWTQKIVDSITPAEKKSFSFLILYLLICYKIALLQTTGVTVHHANKRLTQWLKRVIASFHVQRRCSKQKKKSQTYRNTVEAICKCFPQLDVISSFTFIIETIDPTKA